MVSRRQLLELGISAQAIQHRLTRGRLHRVERGVYALGRSEITVLGRWMAAVLGAGRGAVLSHRSAAALWGLLPGERESQIEVSVPIASERRRPGIRIYRRPGLRAADVTTFESIPVTKPILTLIDVARFLDPSRLERAIDEADRLDLVDPETLLGALDSYPARRGVGRLRALLGGQVFRLTDSELERRFLRLVRSAGLPVPLTRQRVNGFRVDFHWPELGLVVETDGLRYHRTPAQQARDRARDQAHAEAGLTTLRFTHAQVFREPARVRRVLAAVSRRLDGERSPTGVAWARPAAPGA